MLTKNPLVANIALCGIVLILLWGACELFIFFAMPHSEHPGYVMRGNDSVLLTTLSSEAGQTGIFRGGAFGEAVGTWRINNDGWNASTDYGPKTTSRIVVIGDSFVEALHVERNEAFHSIMNDSLPAEVLSIGVSGAQLAQYLPMADYAVRQLDADALVINVVWNDYTDSFTEEIRFAKDWYFRSHFYTLTNFKLIRPRTKAGFNRPQKHRMTLWSYVKMIPGLFHTQDFRANVSKERFEEHWRDRSTARLCDKWPPSLRRTVGDIPVLIVHDADRQQIRDKLPHYRPFMETKERFAAACRKQGFEFLDMTEPFRDDYLLHEKPFSFFSDYHWNQHGHRVVANAILRALRDR